MDASDEHLRNVAIWMEVISPGITTQVAAESGIVLPIEGMARLSLYNHVKKKWELTPTMVNYLKAMYAMTIVSDTITLSDDSITEIDFLISL